MSDALTVDCEDCLAPAGTPCYSRIAGRPNATHAERQRVADLRALEHGTCALCGRAMVRGSVEGSPVDAWHPDETDAAQCPPLPDPVTDWDAYATAITAGARAGHPGPQHFVLTIEPLTQVVLCPECVAGKHVVCVTQALHPVSDEIVPCGCDCQIR